MAIQFIPTKCPACGGQLDIDLANKKAVCKYCQSEFIINDDKVARVEIGNAEQAEEEFEKGRKSVNQKEKTKDTAGSKPDIPVIVRNTSDNSGCVKFFFVAIMIWLAFTTYCGFSM